jgi:SAM-dependent methyltransferase
MMTDLATLVEHKNSLKEIIPKLSIDDTIYSKNQLIESLVSRLDLNEYHGCIDRIRSIYSDIDQKNKDIIAEVGRIIDSIDHNISNILESKSVTSDVLKESSIVSHLPTNEIVRTIFNNKISKISQVRYPGLQINTRLFPPAEINPSNIDGWISLMVASDPLYLMGPNIEILQESLRSFPEIYQKRVRLYELNNTRDLSTLPQAQFNLIFCWDLFNHLSIDIIDFYLQQMMRLLRPGGTLIFTYNNCDLAMSAKLVDWDSASWCTPLLLEKIYSKHGFELIGFDDIISDDVNVSHVSWAELKRPGDLTTSKLSQAIGAVRRK